MTVQDNLLLGAYTRKDGRQVHTSMEQVFDLFPILKQRSAQLAAQAVLECRAHPPSALGRYRESLHRIIYPALRYARAGRQIIFCSNLHDPSRRTFALYLINTDGSGLGR